MRIVWDTVERSPFARLRARFLLPWLFAGLYFGFAPGEVVRSRDWLKAHPDDPLPIALGSLLISALILVGPAIQVRRAGLFMRDLYGEFPSRRQLFQLASLAVPTFGMSMAASYAVFASVSLAFPDAMQEWLFENPAVLYHAGPPYPFLANFAGFLAVVVAAPIAEEWFVRGLLLGRWAHTAGVVRGVIRTSLVFALLHQDPVGSFLFGFLMCGLYAHYGSLWAPTVVHASHNALVWTLAVLATHGPASWRVTTVAGLQAAWWIPVVGVLLMLPWALRLRGRYQPLATWQFAAAAGSYRSGVSSSRAPRRMFPTA